MPVPALQTIDLPGGALAYREAGRKTTTQTPIMFLHGLNCHSAIWMNQFDHFAENHRVIAWDAPSFGGSAPRLTESNTDVGLYADAMKELLDALGLEQVIMVGHSLGGVIAGAFAGKYPERLKALVLSCTHPGGAKTPGTPLHEKYLKRIEERAACDPMEYGRLQAIKMTTDDTPPDLIENIAAVIADTSAEDFPLNAQMSQTTDNRAGLAAFTAPALIINGGHDRLGLAAGKQDLLDTMPHAHRIVFENCGHSPYVEDPAAYNAALEKFFAKVS